MRGGGEWGGGGQLDRNKGLGGGRARGEGCMQAGNFPMIRCE